MMLRMRLRDIRHASDLCHWMDLPSSLCFSMFTKEILRWVGDSKLFYTEKF